MTRGYRSARWQIRPQLQRLAGHGRITLFTAVASGLFKPVPKSANDRSQVFKPSARVTPAVYRHSHSKHARVGCWTGFAPHGLKKRAGKQNWILIFWIEASVICRHKYDLDVCQTLHIVWKCYVRVDTILRSAFPKP